MSSWLREVFGREPTIFKQFCSLERNTREEKMFLGAVMVAAVLVKRWSWVWKLKLMIVSSGQINWELWKNSEVSGRRQASLDGRFGLTMNSGNGQSLGRRPELIEKIVVRCYPQEI